MVDYYYSSNHQTDKSDILDRAVLDNSTVDTHIVEGGKVTWVAATSIRGSTVVVVRNYDSGRYGEYHQGAMLVDPHVIIKCISDCSSSAKVLVYDQDSVLLYTFTNDYSVNPGYCVLRLLFDATTAAYKWELA